MKRLYGDGAYYSREIFNFLAEKGIDPVIKVRRNSSRRAKGSQARKAAVIAQLDDFDEWKNEKGYGKKGHRRSILIHKEDIWRICIRKEIR
ncbi:MAG: transposase [Nitrososphaerota archaeon]|nr:transposase [Nitrososphaerota archaeon]MDG6933026.1 transposase [Nitrososphaerota archaeon]MDG6935532.1 transposase [Nitrososphaerota archaeon]MDG6944248.1 transposase [Nitrososphaerota archaeon]